MDLETKEHVMEFATDWQEKGREQGLREGLEQGLEQGQIRKGQADIIRILEVRFEDIPLELRTLLGKINDLEVLETLLVQAVTAQSLEVFSSVASQHITEEALESENTEQSPGEENDESN